MAPTRSSNSPPTEADLFYLAYIGAELRRRKGRTLLTALGLAVGVGLVATVTALSKGLDNAQDKVLRPLTGVGTDMSVQRPVRAADGRLSAGEQQQLRSENGGVRFGLRNRGKAGSKFEDDNFVTTDLSFPQSQADRVRSLAGVAAAAPALTLNRLHVTGTVPKQQPQQNGFGPPGAGGGAGAGPPGPPNAIDFDQSTISGVDTTQPDLGLVTPSQIQTGAWFKSGARREAIVGTGYAKRKGIAVGDALTIKKKAYRVVGIARAPLGGQASDVYVRLGELQELSGSQGRVNVLRVRAASAGGVTSVSKRIGSVLPGAKVTTA
ncbi:MAG: hypothetical protein QOJ07_3450 [Thermoleophilaceae bacterium]|nr:hypothetical protein [Thermoleophilaceae bacterium]